MTLETIEHSTGAAPGASIVVLHGLGADGHDFAALVDELDLSPLGAVRFVFPHAPARPVTINGGLVMRAWYDILGSDLVRREDERGLRESQAAVEALLARERERGIEPRRIVLAGFSQGCALALMTALRYRERLGGVAGLSGYLPLAGATAMERSEAGRDLPVFLAHGRHDTVVPIARALDSRDALRALGHEVEWHEYPIEHSVSAAEIADLERWLRGVLAS